MYFPRFWTTAKTGRVVTWGWSDTSTEDALAKARERQKRVFAWLDGGRGTLMDGYGYPDRPMREEVLREFRSDEGRLTAAISRNAYGCLVLNTADLLFVDVDTPEEGFGDAVRNLFRRGSVNHQATLEQRLTETASQWVAKHPDWNWRMYRTKAGVRLMASHRPVPSDNPIVIEAFDVFGADPLYRALCKSQRCFRARLTPKPWRCGTGKPPARWPWKDPMAARQFRDWDFLYTKRAADYATCRLIGEFGRSAVPAELNQLVQAHDEATRSHCDLPLA